MYIIINLCLLQIGSGVEIPSCLMGKPDWLGEAVAAAAAHNPEYCVFKWQFCCDGDEKRFGHCFSVRSTAADAFAVIHQFREITRFGGRFDICPQSRDLAQPMVGISKQEPQMGGNPRRRGCAIRHCPSTDNKVRLCLILSKACKISGASRNVNRPGT